MDFVKDLKDLKALLQLCRKQGVTEITLGEVSFKLGELPKQKEDSNQIEIDPENPYANFPDGELTPEQLMFYSAGGMPENDPQNPKTQGESN